MSYPPPGRPGNPQQPWQPQQPLPGWGGQPVGAQPGGFGGQPAQQQPPGSGQPPRQPGPAQPGRLSAPPQAPRKPGRSGGGAPPLRVVAIVGLVLVLAIGGFALFRQVQQERAARAEASASASAEAQRQVDLGETEQVVTDLLTAIVEGRATDALSLLDVGTAEAGGDEPLLADAALEPTLGQVSFDPAVTLTAEDGASYTWGTDLTVGGAAHPITWTVARDGSGAWLVDGQQVLSTLELSRDTPHVINGQSVSTELATVKVLPGVYQVESGMALLRYRAEDSRLTTAGGERLSFTERLVPADGVSEQVIGQVRNHLNTCAASREYPGPCNWSLELSNGTPTSGTISWRLEPADPAATITLPGMWASSNGYANAVSISYETYASGDGVLYDGSSGYFTDAGDYQVSRFTIDLSGDAVAVTFG